MHGQLPGCYSNCSWVFLVCPGVSHLNPSFSCPFTTVCCVSTSPPHRRQCSDPSVPWFHHTQHVPELSFSAGEQLRAALKEGAMGNTMSVPEEAEDDNACTVKSYQALSESPDSIKNGSVAFVQTHSAAMNGEVDAKASVARDNVAVSSPETMEQSPVPEAGGQSPGSAARRARPSAKSRSVFAFSWAVPGRTEDPATDSSVGWAKLDVSSEAPGANKAPSDSAEVPAAAAREEGAHKNLTRAPPAASLHNIDLTASVTPEGEDAAASEPKQVTFFDRIFKLEKGKERSKRQIDAREERQAADLPDGRITAKEAAGLQSTSDGVPQGKAARETQQTATTKRTEQQPVTSVKSDKNVPSSQEPQTTKQNTKAPEPAAQQQAAATEAPKEGTKEKASSTPTPLSKLFWKKNASEEAEIVSNEKADTSLEAAAPDKDESKSPEAAEVKPRREESKTPKANLRKFFKLTLNSTERPLVPAESEPVGQKSKESSKAKKPAAELSKQKGSKQEAREQPDSREQPAAETDSIHNGGDASKEPSFKKTEKRQSLGGFFKGLGSKRMSDAEVQTDPVSILPAGKSK
ncbi:breast carcinoma-amplified sequence 1 isoform X8 [Grus americana]|uniref:breast carcinoma-amplified sequence 1 isoform X8 n=1 Tax=Grus americana TaxID=9117 RepID=UPI0024078AC0|nr:breast carcinoma-amplified sequence 1 isoform X8 [Grus americana]